MTEGVSRALRQPFAGMTLGAGLILAGLPAYVSFETRIVLGRWSPAYAAVMGVGGVAWLAFVGWAFRRSRRSSMAAGPAGRTFGWGCAALGLGYAVTAWRSPAQADRLLDLNLTGSMDPVGALAEWLGASALVLATIMSAWTRAKGRSRDAVVAFASVAALVIVLEGAARLKAFLLPETQGFPTYSEAIWRERFMHFNAMGFRDIDHAADVSDAHRVAVIGDSYAQGWGIRDVRDRFGEQLAERLRVSTGRAWQPMSAGRGDTNTIHHIEYVDSMAKFGPDIIILLYVFNDMDYLHPITRRSILTPSGGIADRLHPARIAFANSYLFQEGFVRLRQITFGIGGSSTASDIYDDSALVDRHLDDITRFVEKARTTGAEVMVVPFDIALVASPELLARYERFLEPMQMREIPTCSLVSAFDGYGFTDLVVNRLDAHPNELGHRLAAEAAASCVAGSLTP